MDAFWNELRPLAPNVSQLMRITLRLVLAMVLGAMLGYERARHGKAAGLRTHMLVALGSALFVLVPNEMAMTVADLSRVIQGVATGIGFIGAGTILKLSEQREIKGLDSAAGIWLTAAVGMAVGAGIFWPAILGAILAWVILDVLRQVEHP